MLKAVSRFGLLICISLLLTACSFAPHPAPTADDVVGTWVNGNTILVLDADGSFILENAPAYARVGEGARWRESTDFDWNEEGDWRLESDAVRIGGQKLFYHFIGSELTLEFGLDLGSDNPRCFQLVRESSSLVAVGPDDCSIRA